MLTQSISKKNLFRLGIFHLSALLVFYVGFSWVAFLIFLISFVARTFGVTAGHHRYFSHRSFRTSRFFQFCLAYLGSSSGQRGPLLWASYHRTHHRTSDTPTDPHTPMRGLFFSYFGWLLVAEGLRTDFELTADFARYPEIRWIDKYYDLATLSVVLFCALLGYFLNRSFPFLGTSALQMVVWGFILSTLVSLHGTMLVNTVCHLEPERNSSTRDHSRNVAWLLPLTLGDNWHHNHHRFPKSANCGLERGQIDFIFLGIKLLEKLGLVSDVRNQILDFSIKAAQVTIPQSTVPQAMSAKESSSDQSLSVE